MEQFDNLIEFRQAIYEHGLAKAQDAQFELLDALLLSSPIRSFPELSLSPVFRRKWPSAYGAIEEGDQDREWLERLLVEQIPPEGTQIFSLPGKVTRLAEGAAPDPSQAASGGQKGLELAQSRLETRLLKSTIQLDSRRVRHTLSTLKFSSSFSLVTTRYSLVRGFKYSANPPDSM